MPGNQTDSLRRKKDLTSVQDLMWDRPACVRRQEWLEISNWHLIISVQFSHDRELSKYSLDPSFCSLLLLHTVNTLKQEVDSELAKTKMMFEPSLECPQVDVKTRPPLWWRTALWSVQPSHWTGLPGDRGSTWFLGKTKVGGASSDPGQISGWRFLQPVDQGKPLQTRCLKRSFHLGWRFSSMTTCSTAPSWLWRTSTCRSSCGPRSVSTICYLRSSRDDQGWI